MVWSKVCKNVISLTCVAGLNCGQPAAARNVFSIGVLWFEEAREGRGGGAPVSVVNVVALSRDGSGTIQTGWKNYYPTVKRRVRNHECFSTSVFLSVFISEDYGLAHSYTLQET